MDALYGFVKVADKMARTGYLINMQSVEVLDENLATVSALDLYFIEMDGTRFKHTFSYYPYFLIYVDERHRFETAQFLKNKFASEILNLKEIIKDDLDLPNHLSGLKKTFLQINFMTQNSLNKVRKFIISAIKQRIDRVKMEDNAGTFDDCIAGLKNVKENEVTDYILDIREHDVPYHIRVSIDLKIFCGMWYTIKIDDKSNLCPNIIAEPTNLERPEPVVLAFDIETTKLPLKFPDPQIDQIIMISYVIDGQGYMITNREIISVDVSDFEYTPKQEFEGHFTVFNETNELMTIKRFFNHIMKVRPNIFVTYNGDFFDWPFIEARASLYDLDMSNHIGISKSRDGVYLSDSILHMDCLYWVKRDSYLPVGSHGLKAVAKAKLCYDPIELDPEDICKMAKYEPQMLSNYSVSDAIATYYLYMKYVHTFIFALSTILPMKPDEILRKGSGTLCETLLMVEAYHANIIYPNKQEDIATKFSQNGQLIDTETYVGGHVEALECGVYRADIPCRFRLDRSIITQLLENVDKVLEHAILKEEGVELKSVTNFHDVTDEIKRSLKGLYDIPNRLEQPVIYHLDVGAMYPNIILTNRLQPSAIVTDTICAACDFNVPNANCKRVMKWQWRGDVLPATKNELHRIKQQIEMEKFPPLQIGTNQRAFHELSYEDQITYEKKRISNYCRSVYKKSKVVKLEERTSIICQKENSFYVDTVRAFRDRRYEYKKLTKIAKQAVDEALKNGNMSEIKSVKNKEILYDSLQLAHKCILNSFYGYVMRKGARWHSMPMAGIVCSTGSQIITKACKIIERIGRPLELDTDGIWCILPASFPQVFTVHSIQSGKNVFNISYPNAVLNNMVREEFTNEQYHELVKNSKAVKPTYQLLSENSIFFEVDGPYLAMVLPAAKEEGKKLKKRYAVFNFDGSIAELKGFEVKRRGELQIIKNFQSSVFKSFLSGSTLQECYNNVSKIANYWLDVLYSHGQNLPDNELFELISENRSMSKKLEEYGTQKSTSITTAKRLAEFLGDQILENHGLACRYVIAKKPTGSPITDRAIPLAIFQCSPEMQKLFLRRWLHDFSVESHDIRDLLDWKYYIERLNGAIQKIITIPAALQGLSNPVPRVPHPDWLHKKIQGTTDKTRQIQITELLNLKSSKRTAEDKFEHMNRKKACIETNVQDKTKTSCKRKCSDVDLSKEASWVRLMGSVPLVKTKLDLSKWILLQKRKWQIQHDGKHNSLKRLCNDDNVVLGKPKTIRRFLKQVQKTVLNNLWEIICITNTNKLGNYIIWAIIENELHKIRLRIPRILYVNEKSQNCSEIINRKKVFSVLPRSTQPYFIFKYNLNEESFRHNRIGTVKNIPSEDIEGVYETKVALDARFLIEIGCLCRVRTNEETNDKCNETNDVYTFEQLEKQTGTHVYLKESWAEIKKIFFYQYTYSEKCQIWGLIFPSTERIVLIFLDKSRTNKISNIERIFAAERITYLKKTGINETIEPLTNNAIVEVFVEVDIIQVYRHIQRSLFAYKDRKKGLTFICTQTPIDPAKIRSIIPFTSDYPIIKIHVSDTEPTNPDLNWQIRMARSMFRHFFNLTNVLNLMLEQSRYLSIPIGNLPPDPVLLGTDIFYARLLQKNNHLLWWSINGRPDLGGKEIEDNRISCEVRYTKSIYQNKPETHSTICIALMIQDLAICALLQSKTIEHFEYGSGDINVETCLENMLTNNSKRKGVVSDLTVCLPAIRILRIMVKNWLRELSLNHSVFAEYHISNIYRWIRSGGSCLYDPMIAKVITNLMEKMLLSLIAELRMLGAIVICADFSRIIINSKKETVLEALNYIDFIVQNIRKQDMFANIQLTFDQMWKKLIWINSDNYVGEKIDLQLNQGNGMSSTNISTSVDIFFPTESMNTSQGEFILKFKELSSLFFHFIIAKQTNPLTIQNLFASLYTFFTDVQKNSLECNIAFSKCVELFLKLMGVYIYSDEINIMKQKIFELINHNEFTKKLIESDNLLLSGMTCKTCKEYNDFDIIRNKQEINKNGSNVWLCHHCSVAYERGEIETLILKSTVARITSYTLQDTKCLRCNEIKKDNFSSVCACSYIIIGRQCKSYADKMDEQRVTRENRRSSLATKEARQARQQQLVERGSTNFTRLQMEYYMALELLIN